MAPFGCESNGNKLEMVKRRVLGEGSVALLR